MVFTLGDARSFFGLTSKIPPLGSMLNSDTDVKKTTSRHQCENYFSHTKSADTLMKFALDIASNFNVDTNVECRVVFCDWPARAGNCALFNTGVGAAGVRASRQRFKRLQVRTEAQPGSDCGHWGTQLQYSNKLLGAESLS